MRPSRVLIAAGLRHRLPEHAPARGAFLLADRAVAQLHPELGDDGWPRLTVAGGEGAKTFRCLEEVLRAMVAAGLDRNACLVVVGGGSVGDVGGLAASMFLRGIDLVQVPTTLLAMLDSSVGGKTAINLPEGKNLVGTFHPASVVLADPDFLDSVSETEFRSGLGEALKVAIGLDPEMFSLLASDADRILARDPDVLAEVVRLGIRAKIRVVESDPQEQGERRLLNLGHTLGHALEAQSGWTLAHGVAVARGLHFALSVAQQLGVLGVADAALCVDLLERYGFHPTPLPPVGQLMPYLARDKKRVADQLVMALPTAVGSAQQVPVELDRLHALLG